jgi:hypothetical protein
LLHGLLEDITDPNYSTHKGFVGRISNSTVKEKRNNPTRKQAEDMKDIVLKIHIDH